MDYIATLLFIGAVVFGGWFYGCKVNTWCGEPRDGVPLTEALSAASRATETATASNTDADKAHKEEARKSEKDQQKDAQKEEAAQEGAGTDKNDAKKQCTPYLTKDIRPGGANDKQEVIKLEKFLNTYEGEKLIAGGVYDGTDQAAVKRFQEKYRKDILDPAGVRNPNGLVLAGTRAKINALYCAQKKSH